MSLLLGAPLVALLGAGCSGTEDDQSSAGDEPAQDGGGGAESIGSLSPTDVADALARAYCEGVEACCDGAGVAADRSGCERGVGAEFAELLPTQDGIRENDAALGACTTALRARLATCRHATRVEFEACAALFLGTKLPGEPCLMDAVCAAPADGWAGCESNESESTPRCETGTGYPHGRLEEPCAGSCWLDPDVGFGCMIRPGSSGSVFCYRAEGLYCPDATEQCTPLASIEEPCSTPGCAEGYCNRAGVCQAYGEPGESCEAGARCADHAYCADDLTCVARKPLGAPCSAWDECEQDCDAISGTCIDQEAFTPDAEICTTEFAYEDWYQP